MSSLAERLGRGETVVGCFVLTGSAAVCELLVRRGLDFVVVDCEHGETTVSGAELPNLLRAVEAGGGAALVRVAECDRAQIGHALDLGAAGVVVPGIGCAAQAEAAVRAAARPPHGVRGAIPVIRQAGYGAEPWEAFAARTAVAPLVVALVESPAGVEAAAAIAAVEGLGMVMFGAFDFAVAAGKVDPRAPDEEIEAARDTVYAAAAAAGLPVADVAWTAARGRELVRRGARAIAVGTDVSLLGGAVAGVRAEVAGP